MADIADEIGRLQSLVGEELDERRIVEEGRAILESLREAWRVRRQDFSDGDVETLRGLRGIVDALAAFIEEQEEFDYLATRDDVDEVVGRLHAVMGQVGELPVAGRVRKEIRELLEKRASLPSRALDRHAAELRRAVSALNGEAPACARCGSRMVLREGPYGFFWGCTRFPECWGKERLRPQERERLPD